MSRLRRKRPDGAAAPPAPNVVAAASLEDEPAASTFDPEHLAPLDALADAPFAGDTGAPQQLGRGAGGLVVSGPDRHLPRTVAWKVARGAHARARLEHEARVLAALEHPSILTIHDLVDEPDGSLHIALRMVRGETLHTLIRRAATPADRVRLLRPFLLAVEAVVWAHRLGWVHRDLKPANLMIGEFGETQVIDWGLAVNLDEASPDPPGTVVGTPLYMSPEQARGERVDATTDVWSLGATLFELVIGETLHDARDPDALVDRVRRATHVPIRLRAQRLPSELVAIIERCLAPLPEDRYPDGHALASDLAAYLDGRVVSAHAYRPLELLRRFVRAYRVPLGIALAVLVTGAIAAVLAFVEIDRERDEAVQARGAALAALAARDDQIATRGVTEAKRELVVGQRPEAELAAARTLAVRESPEARGVLAALSATPRPVRLATAAPPFDCAHVDLAPDGTSALCGDHEALSLRRSDGTGWSLHRPYRGAAFFDAGRGVVVDLHGDTLLHLDAADGRELATYSGAGCVGDLEHEPTRKDLLLRDYSCAVRITKSGPVPLDLCAGTHLETAALGADGVAAALCIGGDLAVRRPDGTLSRGPSALGTEADTSFSSTLIRPPAPPDHPVPPGAQARDLLLVGSSRGSLVALDLRDGHRVLSRSLDPPNAILELVASPDGQLVLARLEGQGALVLHGATLATLARLPREDARFAAFADQGAARRVLTYGAAWSTWDLPLGAPSRLDDLGGITGITLADPTRMLVTHDSSARLLDPRDGRLIAEATWQTVTAKTAILAPDPAAPDASATPTPDRVLVAIAGRRGGEPIVSIDPPHTPTGFVEIDAHRRLERLSGGRLLAARTGFGLSLWRPGRADPVQVLGDQLLDLAARSDFAAVLASSPRAVITLDVAFTPVELGRCDTPSANAIALGPRLPERPEPLVLTVSPTVLTALRVSDCAELVHFTAPSTDFVRAALTRDGRFVLGGTRHGVVHVWRAGGALVGSVQLHTSAVTALTVGPDDQLAYSGAWDGHVSVLDLGTFDRPREHLVASLRAAWSGLPPERAPTPSPVP